MSLWARWDVHGEVGWCGLVEYGLVLDGPRRGSWSSLVLDREKDRPQETET